MRSPRFTCITVSVGLVLGIGAPASLSAQAPVTDSVIEVVPGPFYEAFGNQTWLLGSGYRRLWVDTLSAPVLRIGGTPGGLRLVCSPPTLLSTDLRFVDSDSSRWIFSTVDQPFAARYLPRSLYHSLAGRLVQDVIASMHPAAPTVVPPLYRALGIPYADVRLVALPDDSAVAAFDPDAPGKPGWFGPELLAGETRVPGMEDILEIITTQELWEGVRNGSARIDDRAFLTSRLLDLLVGESAVDYHRVRWGRRQGADDLWTPIPWDRGNAFANFDGVSRWYMRFFFPPLVRFKDTYPDVFDLTFQGSAMDRRFLTSLELATWDSVVAAIQAAVTDSLIEAAVARMPPEFYEENGAELTEILKARRDGLPEAAEAYYRLLAKWVDVHVAEDEAVVDITRLSEARLQLTVRSVEAPNRPPSFARLFRGDETKEIRLYLDGDRDSVAIRGEGRQGIKLRIIRDEGQDIIDPAQNPETEVHDHQTLSDELVATIFKPRFGGHIRLQRTPAALADQCPDPVPTAATDLRSPPRDWGSAWLPVPALGYVSGLGVYAGIGASRTDYAFRKYPFKAQHVLWGGYATSPNSIFAEYYSDFRDVVGPVGGFLGATASGVSNPEFYGLGNETTSDLPDDFYRIDQFQGVVTPLMTLNPQPFTQIALGFYYRHSNTVTGQGNIIDALQPFGSGKVDDVGLAGWFKYDTYNEEIGSPAGIQVNVTSQVGVADGDSTFAMVSGDILGFATSASLPGHPTLALRLGSQINWGAYPFYAAAFLSGTDNLKGFAPNRFGGDASIYLNSELRVFLTEITWPIVANFGVLGIADVGRVFLDGESSNIWHTGFGGGIWFGLFRSGQGFNIALVDGEGLRLYISTGFILKKRRFR